MKLGQRGHEHATFDSHDSSLTEKSRATSRPVSAVYCAQYCGGSLTDCSWHWSNACRKRGVMNASAWLNTTEAYALSRPARSEEGAHSGTSGCVMLRSKDECASPCARMLSRSPVFGSSNSSEGGFPARELRRAKMADRDARENPMHVTGMSAGVSSSVTLQSSVVLNMPAAVASNNLAASCAVNALSASPVGTCARISSGV
mmetsp:Transcript_38049/g.78072  ORF Transcript_38049/g.78072 Transcript_38049/m.78072 type:complete len:202 (+) Transcript_38049:625-1230(+)